MTGLLSVIAWGNRLHNYSGSLTGPENTLSENTLGRNNLMKSWEDQALTVWCVPRNSQFFWSLQLHDFNDGTLYWWGWWQWCNIFLTTWSGGGQNWNELPRLIRGHGTVDPKEPVNHSLNATPHGWLGPSNTCCVGAIRRSVPPLSSLSCSSSQGSQRSESPWQWTRTTLLNAAMCKVCGKEGYINNIMRHIEENHISGLTQTCNLCGKNSRSKDGLRQHRK